MLSFVVSSVCVSPSVCDVDVSSPRITGHITLDYIESNYMNNYLRQVNEVMTKIMVFVPYMSVCVSACAQRNGQSDQFKSDVKC